MPGVLVIASSFWHHHERELTAILTVVLTVAVALAVDRSLARRAARGELNPVIDTRVRFLRRLVALGIVLLGALFALSQFGGLSRLATGVLASSAIVAAVIGFAARQTLANLVAGVMLTIAQPLRIGDTVTIEDQTGTVEDVRLNYTVLCTAEGRRVFIPNERLASGVLRNDTIVDPAVRPEVSLWLPGGADTGLALEALGSQDDALEPRIAEVTHEGIRVTITGPPVSAGARAIREAELRARGLATLRDRGLLGP
jgi:small-conductance mechanosensitive channel